MLVIIILTLTLLCPCQSLANMMDMMVSDPNIMPPPFSVILNESYCGWACDVLDTLGPPPEAILFMPPPPLPPSLQSILAENESLRGRGNENCNFCHLFAEGGIGLEPTVGDSWGGPLKTEESRVSVLVATIIGSILLVFFLIALLFKCKKWKIFPISETCPILSESFLGHKSAPPPCSPDSCISPVVNEKSPQSVITDAPSNKKTSISSKYWKRGSSTVLSHPDGSLMSRQMMMSMHGMNMGDVMNSDMIDPYNDGSCTSSPVYAELDAAGSHVLNQQHMHSHSTLGQHHSNSNTPISQMLLSGSSSISPYAVCSGNTYSEVADAVRMAALGSSAALLPPDGTYDNAAYLSSANANTDMNQHSHYHSRSLRRAAHRAATLAQLGSATPLLASHYHVANNGSPQLNYLTGNRPHKKPRPMHVQNTQHLTRVIPGMPRIMSQDEMQSTRFDRQYEKTGQRRQHGIYNDIPNNSPVLSTFRAPYSLRDTSNPKRPLPPVPGVRL